MNESVTVWVWDYFICSFQIMSLSRLLSAEYLPSLPHSVTALPRVCLRFTSFSLFLQPPSRAPMWLSAAGLLCNAKWLWWLLSAGPGSLGSFTGSPRSHRHTHTQTHIRAQSRVAAVHAGDKMRERSAITHHQLVPRGFLKPGGTELIIHFVKNTCPHIISRLIFSH